LRNFGEVHKKGLRFMSEMYERIEKLCKERGINVTVMCRESGASRGALSDLKFGRKQNLSVETLTKLAAYFGVSVDFLVGQTEQKNPVPTEGTPVSDEDIKFALFGGDGEITDAMYDEVKRFAAFIKQREADKKKE